MILGHIAASDLDTLAAFSTACNAMTSFPKQKSSRVVVFKED